MERVIKPITYRREETMETTTTTTTTDQRAKCMESLIKFIDKRSGIDWRDYYQSPRDKDGIRAFKQDSNIIKRHGRHARILWEQVSWRVNSITYEDIITASRSAFSGRLTYNEDRDRWEYVAGQYHCTEYRAAACAVLAACLWRTLWDSYKDSNKVTKEIRGLCGRGITSEWF